MLIAPDKFKGTLTAREAGEAMARGVRAAAREHGVGVMVEVCPVADGGEGTLEVVGAVLKARMCETEVVGPLAGMRVVARWGMWDIEGGGVGGIIEAAGAVGIAMVAREKRDAMRATSFGLGELIAEAIGAGCEEILVGLGGSACVDGGIGMARALGAAIRVDEASGLAVEGGLTGEECGILGASSWRSGKRLPRIRALCDVENPLLGEGGAAWVFGPQKGASGEEVERLEARLGSLAELCRGKGLDGRPEAKGAGSAGGIGFGLATFLGAELVSGAGLILDLMGFDARARGADLVMTGEGRFDAQTASGKACAEVARRAGLAGAACMVIAGLVDRGDGELEGRLKGAGVRVEAIHGLTDWGAGEDECMRDAGRMVEEAAWRGVGQWLERREGQGKMAKDS